GTSHDTGEFACDSIERWWESRGRRLYPIRSNLSGFRYTEGHWR
ncbi:MAG: hypothetical protein JO252_02105, partial [Planctomycetaceae bacterium]|nr:hypothetical protein [Planctomycetaceae bacterium]